MPNMKDLSRFLQFTNSEHHCFYTWVRIFRGMIYRSEKRKNSQKENYNLEKTDILNNKILLIVLLSQLSISNNYIFHCPQMPCFIRKTYFSERKWYVVKKYLGIFLFPIYNERWHLSVIYISACHMQHFIQNQYRIRLFYWQNKKWQNGFQYNLSNLYVFHI